MIPANSISLHYPHRVDSARILISLLRPSPRLPRGSGKWHWGLFACIPRSFRITSCTPNSPNPFLRWTYTPMIPTIRTEPPAPCDPSRRCAPENPNPVPPGSVPAKKSMARATNCPGIAKIHPAPRPSSHAHPGRLDRPFPAA